MLQKKYPLLKRPPISNRGDYNNNYTLYQNYGFEEMGIPWLKNLIDPMMSEIYKCYLDRAEEPTLVVEQIKQKWGSLRFYYSINSEHRKALHGIDFIDGLGLRIYPESDDDNSLAKEIETIVSRYETKSKEVCEHCGEKGEIRSLSCVLVLCDQCYSKRKKN